MSKRSKFVCPGCGGEGPHFVPPSFGQTGFFMCDPNDRPKLSRTPENYTVECGICRKSIMPGEPWSEIDDWPGFAHQECALTKSGGLVK